MTAITETELVGRIHGTPTRLVLAVTGGGSGAVSTLLSAPGASRTLLSAMIPYCPAAMDEWIAAPPEQYCSARTAAAMAMAAYRKAIQYAADEAIAGDHPLAGIACTASLASDRPKRGRHRFHIGLQSSSSTSTWSVRLESDWRGRAEEEAIVVRQILNVVAEACGLSERLKIAYGDDDEIEPLHVEAPPAWQQLLRGELRMHREGTPVDASQERRAIFPGAFDPLHQGHREIASVAQQSLGVPVEFEISICNVDKPPLDFIQMRKRVEQFDRDATLWLTRGTTFLEKARLFPGATFLVGADTVTRIADVHYYGGETARCDAAIAEIASLGCRFLVFGRAIGGDYHAAGKLDLPEPLAAICRAVPESAFRRDISSTEMRAARREIAS